MLDLLPPTPYTASGQAIVRSIALLAGTLLPGAPAPGQPCPPSAAPAAPPAAQVNRRGAHSPSRYLSIPLRPDYQFDLGYNPITGPGQGEPVTVCFNFQPLSAHFKAAQPGGWSQADFGMNVITPLANFPTVPIGAVRLWSAEWAKVEPQPQQWNFLQLDQEIKLAQARRTPVEVVLGMTPRWAALRPDLVSALWQDRPGLISPPKLEAWANYVRTVARRYKGKVRAYEIWNEPTTPLYWEGTPAQLAEITRIAAQIIHAEDPAALVGSPSGSAVKDQYRDYVAWFEQFLQAGGAEGVDVMIWHFYTDQAPEGPFRQELQTVRQMLDRHGLQAKPLWITEGGFLSNPKVTPQRPAEPLAREAALHLSRYMLVGAVHGMDAFYYYTWDYADASVFVMSQPPKGRNPTAQTWLQVNRWLVGAQVLGLSHSPDGVWAIRLKRNGSEGYIVWDENNEQPIGIPTAWPVSQVADLNGSVTLLERRSAGIGQLPRLFF
jgi:hypothetical protein